MTWKVQLLVLLVLLKLYLTLINNILWLKKNPDTSKVFLSHFSDVEL